MNFVEALKTGQPFRRPHWAFWIWHDPQRGFIVAPCMKDDVTPGFFSDYYAFSGRDGGVLDLLANDYETWEMAVEPDWLDDYLRWR